MKGFDVMHVKSAVKSHNDFDLSKTHLTTMNIGQIVPLYCEELVPGDKFSVNANYFSRMAPLVKPTYGKLQFKTVTGFVPYYMIAEDADAWLDGKTTWEGQTPHQRFITMKTLFSFINQTNLYDNVTSGAAYDFQYINTSGNMQYHKLNQKGKYFVKILNALGYQIPNMVDLRTTSDWSTNMGNKRLSAYPILAFAKLYNDYMSQSQRFNSSTLSTFLTNVKFGKNDTGFTGSTGEIAYQGLNSIFNNLFLNYDNDYFTTAWQHPNNAINGLESIAVNSHPVPGTEWSTEEVASKYDDNRLYTDLDPDTGGSVIGQRALDFLKSFDDWVRRNNYSGSRVVQQIYSRFGIKTDDYRSHYAQVIDTKTIPIQVGDVTSTSDVTGSTVTGLGDYAGKGIVNGDSGFQFKSSDHGLLMILGYYTVIPMNSFGFDRRVLRSTPLDYYNPEFDGLGGDAISVGEFYTDPASFVSGAPFDTAVYGFTERYNSYRFPRDIISGEFRNASTALKGGMDVWHTGRYLTNVRDNGQLLAQSSTVCTLPQEKNEYDRIFGADGDQAGAFDKFYMTAQFHVKAFRPMLSLNQVPRLGEGDTAVARNGNVIS